MQGRGLLGYIFSAVFDLHQFSVIKRCSRVSRNKIQITNAKRGRRTGAESEQLKRELTSGIFDLTKCMICDSKCVPHKDSPPDSAPAAVQALCRDPQNDGELRH